MPGRGRCTIMSNMQAFLLGVMAAWTPSLIVLAFTLWSMPEDHADEVN